MSAWTEAVHNWERCRNGLVAELRAIAPGYLDVRPASGARTAREIAEHLWQASQNHVHRLETKAPFVPGSPAQHQHPPDTDFATLLANDWTGNLKPRLERMEADAGVMLDGMFGPQTVLSYVWFALSHEWYHRGQVATYVRLSGNVPALTQFIMQRQAQAQAPPANS